MGRARWAWAGAVRPQGLRTRPQQLGAESQLWHLFPFAFQLISQAPAGGGVGGPPQRKDLEGALCALSLSCGPDWNFSIPEVWGWGASGIIKWGFRLRQLQISSLVGLPDFAK